MEEGMPLTLPHNLMFAASVLSGYSRNRFKLETTSSDSVTSGRIVTLNLPESALLDMDSFRFFFKADAGKGVLDVSGGATATINGLLPAEAESLISRIEVFINGIQVQQGSSEYNTIAKVCKLGGYNQDAELTKGKLVNHSILYNAAYAANVFDTSSNGEIANLCVDNWTGFLGERSARFLPTDVLGQIQIRLTFAPDSVLSGCAASRAPTALLTPGDTINTAPTYTIKDMYFTIDSIVVGEAYNNIIRSQMSRAYLPINYHEYYIYTNSGLSSTTYSNRFSLSSGSINKIMAVQRLGNHNKFGNATDLAPDDANKSPLEAVGAEAIGKYFTYSTFKGGRDSLDGDFRYQFNVNNVQYPQYLARNGEAMADVAYTNDKVGNRMSGVLVSSPTAFCRGQAVYNLQLSHPDLSIAQMSGYNSRGINSFMTFSAQGITATSYESVVIVQTTSQLRVKSGKSLAVSF
jgi:hypothetical protein